MNNKDPHTEESGFALLAVLVFIFLLASFLTPLSISSHTRVLTSNNSLKKLQAELIVESAMVVAERRLSQDVIESYAKASNDGYICRIGNSNLSVRIVDHYGLIDINAANTELLSFGLRSLGLSFSNSDELAQAILDFRSSRSLIVTAGPFQPENGNKQAQFESLAELHDFPALRVIGLNEIEEIFTVHKKSATITLERAHPKLRSILDEAIDDNPSRSYIINTVAGLRVISLDIYVSKRDSVWESQRHSFQFFGEGTTKTRFLARSISPPSKPFWSQLVLSEVPEFCDALFGNSLPHLLGEVR